MSYGRYLRELLAPLRLYDLEAPFNGGELNVQGGALDGVDTWLAELRRESTLAEAESWGLERIIALLARRPVADTPTGMRKALAALMRIGGDSFTLEAINATISGCGVHAHVEEKEIPGEVAVSFPDIPGIPKGFKEIREIIEDILPAHLGIEYVFWYITWEELERKISCWAEIEERQLTWEQLETLVDETEEWGGGVSGSLGAVRWTASHRSPAGPAPSERRSPRRRWSRDASRTQSGPPEHWPVPA